MEKAVRFTFLYLARHSHWAAVCPQEQRFHDFCDNRSPSRRPIMFCGVAMSVFMLSQPLAAEPLNSINEVSVALQRCWSKTKFAQHDASVTLRFGLKRDGTLLGQPQPSAIIFSGSQDQRRAFVNAAIRAVNDCVPLDFSPKIAGVPGRVFSMEFRSNGSCLDQCSYEESLLP